MNNGAAGAALLAVTSSVSIFHSMLPPFAEVRKSVGSVGVANDVRAGELASTALVVGLGITATYLTKSAVPFVVSLISAAILISVYEQALATTPKEMTHGNNVIAFRR